MSAGSVRRRPPRSLGSQPQPSITPGR
jgi:hypothetical protein